MDATLPPRTAPYMEYYRSIIGHKQFLLYTPSCYLGQPLHTLTTPVVPVANYAGNELCQFHDTIRIARAAGCLRSLNARGKCRTTVSGFLGEVLWFKWWSRWGCLSAN